MQVQAALSKRSPPRINQSWPPVVVRGRPLVSENTFKRKRKIDHV